MGDMVTIMPAVLTFLGEIYWQLHVWDTGKISSPFLSFILTFSGEIYWRYSMCDILVKSLIFFCHLSPMESCWGRKTMTRIQTGQDFEAPLHVAAYNRLASQFGQCFKECHVSLQMSSPCSGIAHPTGSCTWRGKGKLHNTVPVEVVFW